MNELQAQPPQEKQKNTVKAVIWRESGRGLEFLLLRLNQKEAEIENKVGEWHPAGGAKDDSNESDIDATLRETSEETGIPKEYVQVGEVVHEDEWDAYYDGVPGYHFTAKFYSCKYTGPHDLDMRLSREHDSAGWYTVDEFPEGATPEFRKAANEVVRRLQDE